METTEDDAIRVASHLASMQFLGANKGGKTLEDQIAPFDLVETYIPVLNGDRMLEVFEIHYDISLRKDHLRTKGFSESREAGAGCDLSHKVGRWKSWGCHYAHQ